MPDPSVGTAVRVRYFLRIPNVGDRINPAVVTALTGLPTCVAGDGALPHLLCAGSMMAAATAVDLVWGTGVMHPAFGIGAVRPENVFAVRGRLSLAELARQGRAPGDVPWGDPGWLAPTLLGISRSSSPTHDLGVAAHYVDRWHPAVRRLLATPGVCDLDVRLEPEEFLRRMAGCAAVASSSLHGLVFAEALGLPSVWFTATADIAGGTFKFDDWFSTTRRPQHRPRRLGFWDTARSLARQAEPRESAIVAADLMAAFPRGRLDEVRDGRRPRLAVRAARSAPLPVFLISFNRGRMLERSIAGLRHLSRPLEVVVHDNGSTDPETLDILADLGRQGVRVFHRGAIGHPDELNRVNDTVAEFFADWGEPGRYAVSDCDVDLSVADADALDIYDELLDRFRQVECVGPMLRIRDIPRSYPLYNRVMNIHVPFAWGRRPAWVACMRGLVAYQECPIDTTFAVHRAGEPFRRLKRAIRVYEPYEALHLDWYGEPGAADRYHETSHAAISHWNNREQRGQPGEPLRHRSIFFVRRTGRRLRVVRQRLQPGV